MPLSNFDRYFLHLPPLDRRIDFEDFWEQALTEIKKTPLETELRKNAKKTTHRFNAFDVSYRGFTKALINGELLVPKVKMKPKVIVHVHDYNKTQNYPQQILDDTVAHFFITLRGHNDLVTAQKSDEERRTPGYMIENILDRDTYYVKAVYLDVRRSIDVLRLMPELNCSSMAFIGKGFGAAAALFSTAHSERVTALALETPSFCYLPMSQNLSTSDASTEINEFVSTIKTKKKQIKENLTYFDALNFSDRISCPVFATVGFKDTISPPECVFALFNHFLCEKVIEVYPEEGNSAGGNEQYRKSVSWLADRIHRIG